jgi:hypothetical protein
MDNKHSGFIPDLGEFTPKDGEPYRPSNGTEGEFFQERWCEHCRADKDFREAFAQNGSGDGGCSILGRTMLYDAEHELYPKEWQWQKGEPVCTAFDDVSATITNEERAAQLPLIA